MVDYDETLHWSGPGYWVTEDEQEYKISEMSTNHLANTLELLKRREKDAYDRANSVASFAATCRGDMATYYADNASDSAYAFAQAVTFKISELEEELKTRDYIDVKVPSMFQ